MQQSGRLLHVGFAFDQNFVTPFYVLLTSIFANCKDHPFHIHVIATGVADAEKASLEAYVAANGARIFFYQIDPTVIRDFVIPKGTEFSLANYYRLFLPLVVPDSVERLLYLDIDTIVLNDLSSVYSTNLDNSPVAAVADAVIKKSPALGINTPGLYFNSGVLLIHIAAWKRLLVTEQSIQFILQHPEKISWADQDALNFLLHKNWVVLEQKYNVQSPAVPVGSPKMLAAFAREQVVIHYNSSNKPWKPFCTHGLQFLYQYYFNRSPKSLHQQQSGLRLYRSLVVGYVTRTLVGFYLRSSLLRALWAKTSPLFVKIPKW